MPAHSNAALAAYPMLACPVVDKFIGVLPGLGGIMLTSFIVRGMKMFIISCKTFLMR